MAIKTQGTQAYIIDPKKWKTNPSDAIIKIGCIDGLDTGGNPADDIEVACLEADARAYIKGLRTPGDLSGTISYDPNDESHQRLYELSVSDDIEESKYWILIGLSDGKNIEPEFDTSGIFQLPEDTNGNLTRSWFVVDGYVKDFTLTFSGNSKVEVPLSIKRSSFSGLWRKGTKFTLSTEQSNLLSNWSNNG